jgi:hypothetical protein
MILFLIPLSIITFLLFIIFQAYAAFLGFDFYFGSIWATFAIFLSIIFRLPLPISIAAFFGAVNVWHWPWFLAALFILPSLLLLIPGILVLLLARMKLDFFFKTHFALKKDQVIIRMEKIHSLKQKKICQKIPSSTLNILT